MSKTPQNRQQKEPKLISSSKLQKNQNKATKSVLKGTEKILKIQTDQIVTIANPATGELDNYEYSLVRKIEGDFDFHKIFIYNFIDSIGHLGNSILRVAMWLVKNKNKENMVLTTAENIAKQLKICNKTAYESLKILTENNFMQKPKGSKGVYVINPDIIFKGSNASRMAVVTVYNKITKEQKLPPFQDKKEEMKLSIKNKENEIKNLKEKLQNLDFDSFLIANDNDIKKSAEEFEIIRDNIHRDLDKKENELKELLKSARGL